MLTRVGDSRTVDRTALAARVLEHGRHDPARPGMLGRAAEIELGPLDGPVSIVAMHQGIAFMRLRTRR